MTYKLKIKDIYIGGGSKIAIQSMTDTKTENVEATLKQIDELYAAGCDIIRLAVPNFTAAESLKTIVDKSKLPVVADIHFDYKLAVSAMENGVHKIRFNPGNIGDDCKVKILADCAKMHNVPIRIGVNSGSVEKEIKLSCPDKAEQLVCSALKHVSLLERFGFNDICISVKSSSVKTTVDAYRMLNKQVFYPLHLGVTEAGTTEMGEIKSAIGIGSLLLDGIGDTIRVSLTDDPVKEIYAAKKILKSLGLMSHAEVISCPTCGRCNIDLKKLAEEVNFIAKDISKPLKLAVMGCVVNGPGEAEEADLGIAGGNGQAVIFKKGKKIETVDISQALTQFKKHLETLL